MNIKIRIENEKFKSKPGPVMGDMKKGQMARIIDRSYGKSLDAIVIRTVSPTKGWFVLPLECFWAENNCPDIVKWKIKFLSTDEVVELRNEN